MLEFSESIEVFVRGFAFTRSMTHPYVAARLGKLWVMRDGPRTGGSYRTPEWVAHGVLPTEVDRVVRRTSEGRFAISAIYATEEDGDLLRKQYKALGYRLRTSESFMAHDLREIPQCEPPRGIEIQRVLTRSLADRLAKAARARQILPEYLTDDAPMRQYVAEAAGKLVGWVRSIVVEAGGRPATWCSNMYVVPAFRRRGIARAMLCRMLHDDRTGGAQEAILLASHAGAKLYPVVGYKQIGTLLLFAPPR